MTEQHRVWVPEIADTADFIEECTTFPEGAHDDMVDVFAYAAAEIYKRTVHGKRSKVHREKTHADKVWDQIQKNKTNRVNHPILGNWK